MTAPHLTCLCGAINQTFPGLTLPAPTELCHCNPCRQVTGALFGSFIELPYAPNPNVLEKCTTYHSSKTHNRLFCSTCGSKTLVHVHHHAGGRERDTWFAYSGAIERAGGNKQPNTIRAETNDFVSDTVDGGLAPHMTRLDDRPVPAYALHAPEPPLSDNDLTKMSTPTNSTPLSPSDRLTAQCRCKSITLSILPASHNATQTLDRFIPTNPTTSTKINDKYQARTCTCRSCRLAFGQPLTTHIYLPPAQILNPATDQPLAYAHAATTAQGQAANEGLESLTHYWSSEHACRSFCGRCGSTVFYWNENRKAIVNVAAGILRAEEGALARRWVWWQPGVCSWKDEVVDGEVLGAYLEAGHVNG